MERLSQALNIAFRLCECAALIALVYFVHSTTQALNRTAEIIQAQSIALPAMVDKQLTDIRHDANSQLTQTRKLIATELTPISKSLVITASQLTATLHATNDTLAAIHTQTIPAINSTVAASNELIASKDVSGLVRDLRFTAARTARTMGHVEQTSDVIAKEAPKMSNDIQGLVENSSELAGSGHQIVDTGNKILTKFTGPQTLKQKIWNGFKLFAEIASRAL